MHARAGTTIEEMLAAAKKHGEKAAAHIAAIDANFLAREPAAMALEVAMVAACATGSPPLRG